MSAKKETCKGINRRGDSCRLPPKTNSDYCRFHQPEEQKIKDFFESHKDGILRFLAEADADSVAGAISDFFKEKSGVERFESPVVPFRQGEQAKALSAGFEKHKSLGNLFALVSFLLETKVTRQNVRQLLGTPLWSKVTRCDRFDIELLDDCNVFVEFWYDVASLSEHSPNDCVTGLWVTYR